jgi:hypothetical protein
MQFRSLFKILLKGKKYKHESTRVNFRVIKPIYPPPGDNLQIPDWPVSTFLEKIGMGCEKFSSEFQSIQEVLSSKGEDMKKKNIPADPRRYIQMISERLRRGVLTFEYLNTRKITSLSQVQNASK